MPDLLETYTLELKQDTKIDILSLKDYAMQLPAIKHKWVGRCIRHKLDLSKLKKKQAALKKALFEEAKKTAIVTYSDAVIMRQIEKHDSIVQLEDEAEMLELVIQLLEKAEKVLSSTSYDLKSIIDIEKLETT